MSVEIDVTYEGGLHCTATHGPSGSTLVTDAPRDNGGQGSAFSPTDLVATALATCVVTTMAIFAQRHDIELKGVRVHVSKEMVSQPSRRIGALPVKVTVPPEVAKRLADADRERLEQVAHACPVHRSLHPDVQAPIEFVYET